MAKSVFDQNNFTVIGHQRNLGWNLGISWFAFRIVCQPTSYDYIHVPPPLFPDPEKTGGGVIIGYRLITTLYRLAASTVLASIIRMQNFGLKNVSCFI